MGQPPVWQMRGKSFANGCDNNRHQQRQATRYRNYQILRLPLTRSSLLNGRYVSELRRLNFVSEGSIFSARLQEAAPDSITAPVGLSSWLIQAQPQAIRKLRCR